MGASGKIFAEAFPDQKLPSWISAHAHAYQFYGGVPALTVPDNTRTAVVRPCRYEPLLHRTYQEMAEHYGTVILPARIRKPRDKAKAESAVQVAQRQILAALRDVDFFSVGEFNRAIVPRLQEINARPFQKLDGSRDQWFQTLDRPKLRPLPPSPFVMASWLEATVNIDYHVVVDHHYYSVPCGLIHQRLQVRLSQTTVELFHKSRRVIGQFLALVAQGLNLGLGGRIGNDEPSDCAVYVAHRHRRLVGPGSLHDRGGAPEPDLCRGAAADLRLPRIPPAWRFSVPCVTFRIR